MYARSTALKRIQLAVCFGLLGLTAVGCQKKDAAPAGGAGMQGMPVQTATVTLAPVPQTSEYVATIKSRRSATLMPQVMGAITKIGVHSGDQVKVGQVLMDVDPRQQEATVESLRATERQKKALYDYNAIEVDRQHKLFDAGVTSRDTYDQALQSFANTKADFESAVQARKTQEQLLDYYTIRAPFTGVVGDIPVHVGDLVAPTNSPPNVLTTVDEIGDLEAYIYIPTERAGQVKQGLGVDLTDTGGNLIEKTKIDFVSAQVDTTTQGILVKAPVHPSPEVMRNAQLVKARVIWNTLPMAVVPVLAVTRQGGQTFVFVAAQQNGHLIAQQTAVTVGDTVGNNYSIASGLKPGDKVIVSSTQFLVNGMPVMQLPGA
jgi:RND family efflux transporter MFP subunit